jgi:hypothetical protein
MKAIFRALALADIEVQLDYLRETDASDEIVVGLLEDLDQAKQKIERHPQTWSFALGSRRVRKVQIPRFRLQVFYIIRKDGTPVILEVAGPGFQPRWVERL